jgi:phosphoesterase RecJ-like protein
MNFIGKVISVLKFDSSGTICWASIDNWADGDHDLTEVIFSIMRLLKGVEVFMLFKNTGNNRVRVNFRSRARVDVNKIAKFFGGGGHKRASGTTVEGDFKTVEQHVIEYVCRNAGKKNK